ncbi:hypothetical protein [Desulfocicer vacuolatum]|nr:hypothetical protein [Desulfocicer vacuolatum]
MKRSTDMRRISSFVVGRIGSEYGPPVSAIWSSSTAQIDIFSDVSIQ